MTERNMTEVSMIEINNVWKTYGDTVVLERLNLSVKEGEFVTLVGASGCGKSTFLNMLLGTTTPTQGEILLDGKAISDEPDDERGIVFQQYSVFPHMTVLDNVMAAKGFKQPGISGWLFGDKRKQAKAEASEILQQVGLAHALDKYPHELSGGMKQRLAIAQALLGKPRILLLDEPFGALDPGIRADMHELVLRLWKEYQLTVFMVTHDLSEGFYLGTRLWVFDKHRLDPQAPGRFGAGVTYDLAVGNTAEKEFRAINQDVKETALAVNS